jgi:hypothetical protein
MLFRALAVVSLSAVALGHGDHEHQTPISGPHKSLWYNTLPGDGGTQVDSLDWMVCSSTNIFRPTLFSLASPPLAGCPTFPAWQVMKRPSILPS